MKLVIRLIPNSIDFEDVVIKNLNDKMPETLTILRLAKEEAKALRRMYFGHPRAYEEGQNPL